MDWLENLFVEPFGRWIALWVFLSSSFGSLLLGLLTQGMPSRFMPRLLAWGGTGLAFAGSSLCAVSFAEQQHSHQITEEKAATHALGLLIDGTWRYSSESCEAARQFIAVAPNVVRVVEGGFPEDQDAIIFGANAVVLTENDQQGTRYKYTRVDADSLTQGTKISSTPLELAKCP